MEILKYLHLTAQRLLVVAAVCLAAGGATAVVLADSSGEYEAEVVVFAGRALPSDRSAFEVTPFVGDLATVTALDPVQAEIAVASGVAPGDVDVETEETADGSALAIRSVAGTPEQAETIAFEASRVALSNLLSQEEDRAQRTVDATEAQLLDVRADLEEFRGENNTQDPIEEYRIAAEALSFVQLQLPNPALIGEGRAALEESLPTLQAELDRLAPLRAPYGELTRAEISAETAYTEARQELLEAESLVAAAANGDFVVATAAEPLSSRESLVAGVAVAVLVAGLLTIAVFVVLDTLRARDTTADDEAPTSGRDHGRRLLATIRRFVEPHPAPSTEHAPRAAVDEGSGATVAGDAATSGNGAAAEPTAPRDRTGDTRADAPASNGTAASTRERDRESGSGTRERRTTSGERSAATRRGAGGDRSPRSAQRTTGGATGFRPRSGGGSGGSPVRAADDEGSVPVNGSGDESDDHGARREDASPTAAGRGHDERRGRAR